VFFYILVEGELNVEYPSLLVCYFVLNVVVLTKYRVTISNRIGWAGHVTRFGKRGIYVVFVGKLEGKKQLGRFTPRMSILHVACYIKVDFEEMGWSYVN
jgi:hypothetical protein